MAAGKVFATQAWEAEIGIPVFMSKDRQGIILLDQPV